MTPSAGDIVAGKYRLVKELGSGSQGRVWRAVHEKMGTPLAVKILDPKLAARKDYFARFKREARAAATLRSPNVVQIFDFDLWKGCPYIAMELLEGTDLAGKLEREHKLPLADVARIVSQVARALSRAHRQQIIHRDLKPDNIFLVSPDEEEEQIVKILDFGVAKAPVSDSLAMTGTGVVLGTPYYMSPEQAQGESGVNFATDLWALGVITYESIIGRRPFEAQNLGDLLLKICAMEPPIPSAADPTVPPGFDDWFKQACAHDPTKRFSSAKEMASALNIIAGQSPNHMLDSSFVDLRGASRARPRQEAYSDLESAETEIVGAPETVRDPRIGFDEDEIEVSISENDPTEVMASVPDAMALYGDGNGDSSVELTADDLLVPEQDVTDFATAETMRDSSNQAVQPVLERSSDGDEIHVFNRDEVKRGLELAAQQSSHTAPRRRSEKWKMVVYPVGGGILMGVVIVLAMYFWAGHP